LRRRASLLRLWLWLRLDPLSVPLSLPLSLPLEPLLPLSLPLPLLL
jgi:hypothetical protein